MTEILGLSRNGASATENSASCSAATAAAMRARSRSSPVSPTKLRAPLPTGRSSTATWNSPRPIIRDGLDRLSRRGATHILAVPGMLFAAGHAKNDIPSVLNT